MDLLTQLYESGFEGFAQTAAFVTLYLALFLFAKWLKDFFTPYRINDELTQKDNLAIALTMSGYYFGVVAIFIGALLGPTQGLIEDLITVGGYSMLGLLFLNLSRIINDKVILREFCNVEQLTVEHNNAVGIVQFGTYVATGLIAAGSVTGTGGGILTAVLFFIIGQVALLLFTLIYDRITPYCIHDALKDKNVAVGAALAGNLIALGIIILNGVSEDFVSWQENLIYLAGVTVIAFLFLPLIRWLMDRLVVPGDSLSREIITDRNLGAGLLEATIAISFAMVLKLIL